MWEDIGALVEGPTMGMIGAIGGQKRASTSAIQARARALDADLVNPTHPSTPPPDRMYPPFTPHD